MKASGSNANTLSGIISGTGAFTQSGAGGITSVTGTNTYTGSTSVTAGTLQLSGSGAINGSSGITLNGAGAKFLQTSSVASTPAITLTQGILDGTTTVGAVTVGNGTGGIIANGNGSTTALMLGALTFNGVGTTTLNMAGSAGLAVSGALGTTPANGLVTINVTNVWSAGLNNLISYGSFSGAASDFTLGTISGLSGRQTASGLQLNGNNIALNIAGDTPVWSGAAAASGTRQPPTTTPGRITGP